MLNAGKSSGRRKTNCLVDHVLVGGSPQPALANAEWRCPSRNSAIKSRPPGLRTRCICGDCGLLIILSYVVQGEGARHRVEAGVSERKPLRESGLKVCRQSMPAGSRGCQLDHLSGCIDPIHRSGRSYCAANTFARRPLPHPTSRTRSPSPQLQIVSEHRPESPAAWAEQPGLIGRRYVPSGSG